MTSIEEYKQLADMSSRDACPKCQGFGFIHTVQERHDRPNTQRCKRCIDCFVCDGSGVTMGVFECRKCSAKGFIHPKTCQRPHLLAEHVRCFDCVVCKDCNGACVLDRKRLDEIKALQHKKSKARDSHNLLQLQGKADVLSVESGMLALPPMVPDTAALLQNMVPTVINPLGMHPHMQHILGIPLSPEILAILTEIEGLNKPVIDESRQVTTCPICSGLGFRHTSSAKHDRKQNEKCKHCIQCKACFGAGTVKGKRQCSTCNMRGFVHATQERGHDVPENLRCFFCKDCPTCKGTGLESIRKKKVVV